MKDELNYIDEVVQKSLGDFNVESSEEDWANFEQKMSSKTPHLNHFLLAFTSLIIAVIAIYWFTKSSQNIKIKSNKVRTDSTNIYTESAENGSTFTINKETHTLSNKIQNSSKQQLTENNSTRLCTTEVITKLKEAEKQLANTIAYSLRQKNCSIDSKHIFKTSKLKTEDTTTCILPSRTFEGCMPFTQQFYAELSNFKAAFWSFGDGSISREENPTHTYQEAGIYIVRLEAYSFSNERVIYRYDTIKVAEKPIANFHLLKDTLELPEATLRCYPDVKGIQHCVWNFGDGSISKEENPSYRYKQKGTYTISLAVWNNKECSDSISINNAVTVRLAGAIEFPNAFMPDVSGSNGGYYVENEKRNTVFHPVYFGIAEYYLSIYDRFGTLLFESSDIHRGWDGYVNYNLCKSDVYIWTVKGKYKNGASFFKKGDVMLLLNR